MSNSSPTLFDIVLGVADELGILEYGTATGGTTSTLVDTSIREDLDDDTFKYGTLFLTYDAGGASAAPEGEFAEVTAYTHSSRTFASTWTVAPASGDHYALAGKDWTLDDLRGAVNRALVRMGDVPLTDTSLSTSASTTEYTIPAAARRGLRRVYMDQYSTSGDTRPQEISNWRLGFDNTLYLPVQPASGKSLTLVYMGTHDTLNVYSDALSPYVPLRRVIAEATVQALRERVKQDSSRDVMQHFNDAAVELESVKKMFPIMDPGTVFKPILKGKRRGLSGRHNPRYGQWYLGS